MTPSGSPLEAAAGTYRESSPRQRSTGGPPAVVPATRGLPATVWNAVSAAVGAVMGLLPHVLHHVGLLAGAALVTGVTGNRAFGIAGLLLSIPMLMRLHRRFRTWKAPAAAIAVFAVAFSLSAFVVGPALTDDRAQPVQPPTPPSGPGPAGHDSHHGG
jgi:hypothetical protein